MLSPNPRMHRRDPLPTHRTPRDQPDKQAHVRHDAFIIGFARRTMCRWTLRCGVHAHFVTTAIQSPLLPPAFRGCVVRRHPTRRLTAAVGIATTEWTAQIPALFVRGRRQKEDAARPTVLQATAQIRRKAKRRTQAHIVRPNKFPHLTGAVPVRVIRKINPDF